MYMELNVKRIIISTVLFILIDSIYLKLVSPLFNKLINNIQGSDIKLRFDGALYAYICIVFVFNYFTSIVCGCWCIRCIIFINTNFWYFIRKLVN